MYFKSQIKDNVLKIKLRKPLLTVSALSQLSNEIIKVDDDTRCVELRSRPKVFSGGLDLNKTQSSDLKQITNIWFNLWNCNKMLIGLVDGLAYGLGFELLLMCDIVVATRRSRFALPEINYNLIPGFGGTQIVTRMLAGCQSMNILLGSEINAEEAFRFNFISHLVENSQEAECVSKTIVDKIKTTSPKTIDALKDLRRQVLEGTKFSEGIRNENAYFSDLFSIRIKEK